MILEEKQMSGLILEALMECKLVEEIGTPDLEAMANFVAEYIVKKGFWMEG